jgi:hypothetical protein
MAWIRVKMVKQSAGDEYEAVVNTERILKLAPGTRPELWCWITFTGEPVGAKQMRVAEPMESLWARILAAEREQRS